ncbi:DUF2270 domain-containing protein [Ensifer sp. LCM 4579]|uniref:DUF2270 domain-containing protein n=1 Tax=Ensifer sp. LCM 4579 TaxID=1848292 RepID=UPI0008D9E1F4|nr:DUF2270 domain-containing protein [Ensifer sp. LCM 4579]OHV77871.1 hypothetical protein LCM4579_05790 [Ensifer sp. LCM 4579]
MAEADITQHRRELTSAELGALAHLYRGEIYRSTIWRTRLDTTTNWAVVTLGVALSITFSSPSASPLPLVLVGILILFFLMLESRRYRYFNVWRARARWLERYFFAPMLKDGDFHMERDWQKVLAEDYLHPHYHSSFMTAVGRRIRRNYLWILLIQSVSYIGKLIVHPVPLATLDQFWRRADVGPIPGEIVAAAGAIYVGVWLAIALWSEWDDRTRFGRAPSSSGMG